MCLSRLAAPAPTLLPLVLRLCFPLLLSCFPCVSCYPRYFCPILRCLFVSSSVILVYVVVFKWSLQGSRNATDWKRICCNFVAFAAVETDVSISTAKGSRPRSKSHQFLNNRLIADVAFREKKVERSSLLENYEFSREEEVDGVVLLIWSHSFVFCKQQDARNLQFSVFLFPPV